MSNWLKKFGSKLFIYLTAFVLSFILIFVIVFTIILGNVKNNVKNSFTNVEKVFQNLSTDTINDNYNLFLEGIVDVETNAMEYVINDYTNQLNYLSDLISAIYKEDQLDGGSFFGIPGEIDTYYSATNSKFQIENVSAKACNINGYIGNSTKNEIEYAKNNGKEVIYHEKID